MTQASSDTRWTRVKWTEARQVAALVDGLELAPEEGALEPKAFVESRERSGRLSDAVRFLAAALPRIEAVGWAAETLEASGARGPAERATLDAAGRWLQSPEDASRRAVWSGARELGGPAMALGGAVFFSGGSIAPEDCPAAPPPEHVCGAMVGACVLGASWRGPDPDAAMRGALKAGSAIAAGAR